MDDLKERLREMGEHPCRAHLEMGSDLRKAADRIEALEKLVRDLAAEPPGGEVWQRSKRFAAYSERARQALGEGQ